MTDTFPCMKPLLFLLLLSGLLSGLAADVKPFEERVQEFCAKHRTPAEIQKQHEEWSKQEPGNPDAWILPANALGRAAEMVNINAGKGKEGEFVLTDPKSGKQVGTIEAGTDSALLKQAGALLAAAAKKFPQRMDVHVGRMAMAQNAGDIPSLKSAAFDLLDATAKDPASMRWIDNAAIEGSALEKAIGEVRSRIRWLYGLEQDESDKAAHECAVKALELAPDNVKLINEAAMYLLYQGQWKEGREYLLRAEKIVPQDWVVQHNIARASAELGDKADALRRLKAIIKAVPDSRDAEAAEASIESLKLEAK